MPYTPQTWADGSGGGTPISAARLNFMEAGIDGAHTTADDLATATTGRLNVRNYGAVGDGTTDDSAAFAAAVAAAKATLHFLPQVTQVDRNVTAFIEVPPGDYLITNPGAMLGDEAMTVKGVGLVYRGAGENASNIIFKPATAAAMMTNDYWQGLKFTDLGFHAATAGCTFLQSYTTHNAQEYNFTSCRFKGWKYVADLQGDNNNSEWAFINCHAQAIENAGAFFFIGATSTSDQFLNYWFYGCTYWTTSAPFIDATKGGSFHIYGLDVSDWGNALTSTGYVFNLRGTNHALGMCGFSVVGMRVEAKNANAALLYSEWPQGNVTLSAVDWSSQAGTYTYNDIIYLYYANTDGATYTFSDCYLAGGVRVRFSVNDWQHVHSASFVRCNWVQRNSPSDVVSYDSSSASPWTGSFPPVDFIGCRGPTTDVFNTAGVAVWDARIGYRGQPYQSLVERAVSLRDAGFALQGSAAYVVLPVGALITSFKALSPAGAVTEADGGSWTLQTTEVTPTTIATATVSGAMSAGFDVTASVSPPFLCDTAAKAKVKITPSNVSQQNAAALVLIKGYW